MTIELGLVAMAIFVPVVILMAVLIYLADRHLERIESHLANCKYIDDLRRTFSGVGLLGEVLRVCVIGCVLIAPWPYARRGWIDLDEVKRFPLGMKRLIVGLWLTLVILFLMIIVLYVVGKNLKQ